MTMDYEDLARMNRVLRHRLRNMASGIQNAVVLLGQELDTRMTPAEREYFPLLRQECDELRKISDRINLLFAQLPAGAETSVQEALTIAIEKLHADYPSVSIEFVNSEKGTTRYYPGQWLEMVLLEILRNAAQASPNGNIKINGTVSPESNLIISVQDDGPGMDSEVYENLFTPFFTTRPRHLGVGLTAARRWMEKLGGTIRFTHPGETRGVHVEIALPATMPDNNNNAT